jgi:hypothetical protein
MTHIKILDGGQMLQNLFDFIKIMINDILNQEN